MYNEQKKEQKRLYYIKNKEKILEQRKLHYIQNKEKIAERHRLYNQTDIGKKSNIISSWRSQGILCFDYNLLYSYYINTTTCEFCDKTFTSTKDRHLDHDHSITDRFNVRRVLCRSCNMKDVLKLEELN